ncbi:binding-protein-dependent transport system inner membrane protein [Mycolicibacterium phlei]|jgi:peptide/nickel transport system permease protein|uniref:Peptide ABC transporter permease n=1 Tax=Mycolicibacterium phlei DSM 43239 = CCUG 21000 TaxID=1226750 RepID=A0A5N5UVB6_MYCPH|nr:ABC transporter permease [Mycolicibacterium phlei]VEG07871.1 binding-protein-dependent transport system inner membrane protein [Mycobacteroides chelonae]AMO59743.1 Glutathione transport system permease protein GsiC [Mycolicibacterium phlei]EID10623.1 peptide ABC transporter permease [Mycolicibacterium phlei RIVM601174]KAB7753561.1 peptide ABC transporter permease [Mycolicibacterium phlei DSM 43239 = CCUG 21000]KXW62464.1 peptide ABC transporter permease [Mycolicibacterium phlei DSM 43239 = 
MIRYLLRRGAQGLFVLWAAFTLTFVVLFLLPSDPVEIMLNSGGDQVAVDPETIAALRAEHHLDKPVHLQYLHTLADAVRGDFGRSVPTNEEVTTLIGEALPQTLQLAVVAFVLSLIAGGTLALVATYSQIRPVRQFLLSLPPVGVSVPTFWIGLVALQLFSFGTGWFPATGNNGFASVVLPAVTLAVPTSAVFAQLLAKNLMTTWRQPYIDTAIAKGVPRWAIQLRHALRNASIPVLTIVGVTFGNLLAGAVVVETVFSRNGIGRLTEQAVAAQDIPMLLALVVLAAAIFVVVNLLVDIVYPIVDPRISRVQPVTLGGETS